MINEEYLIIIDNLIEKIPTHMRFLKSKKNRVYNFYNKVTRNLSIIILFYKNDKLE